MYIHAALSFRYVEGLPIANMAQILHDLVLYASMIGSPLQELYRVVNLTLIEGSGWLTSEASANSQANCVSCRSCEQDSSKSRAIYLAIALDDLSRVHAPAMAKLSLHLQVQGRISSSAVSAPVHACRRSL